MKSTKHGTAGDLRLSVGDARTYRTQQSDYTCQACGRVVLPDKIPLDQFLTTTEVAARLSINRLTLQTWRHHGHGPDYYQFAGVRYRWGDVVAWIKERRKVPDDPSEGTSRKNKA